MSSNMSLLRKADLAIEDFRQNGGELAAEEGASFIRKLIAEPTLIKVARVVEMSASSRKINKIGFGKRILRKATSATALGAPTASGLGGRAKPTTEQIELNTKEQIAEVRIPYDVMEDNIERATAANNEASNTGPGGLRQTIIDLIAQRASLDIEELSLRGDTDYTNGSDADDEAFLSQLDGWLKRASEDGHVVDVNGQTISKRVFKAGLKALPSQYKRNKRSLVHFVSDNNEAEYRDTLADRGTALGDANVQGDNPVWAYGSPVTPVALMPEDRGLYTNPLNLIMGIQRQISLEFDKNISERVYIIVLTLRMDVQIEETDAIVTYENIAENDDF